jgi:hypothetical protein
MVRCCIQTIESAHATHDLVVAAARAIEADARFSVSFHHLKSTMAEDALMKRLEQFEESSTAVVAAAHRFEADPQHEIGGLLAAFSRLQELLGHP